MNPHPKAARAFFVGETTLIVRCCEMFLASGNAIVGIASRNARVRQWAEHNEIECVADWREMDAEFDFLFSVGNLTILPDHMIRRAKCAAINFHDGPLPGYAGLNVPTWALLDGQTHHAVTWHEMTAVPDAGMIVEELRFALEDGETTATLNARCYEAGAQSFEKLVANIAAGTLQMRPQSGERRYFGKSCRPRSAGLIPFGSSADAVLRLIRSLDFGAHPNPIGRPKLIIEGRALTVEQGVKGAAFPSQRPGTVLAVSADSVTIGTATEPVVLSGWRDADGSALRPLDAFREGQVTEVIGSQPKKQLETADLAAANSEPYWLQRLLDCRRVDPAFPGGMEQADPAHGATWHHQRLATLPAADASIAIAAFIAWLSIVSGENTISATIENDRSRAATFGVEAWFETSRLISVDVDANVTVDELRRRIEAAMATALSHGPIARDLVARRSDSGALPMRLADLPVAILFSSLSDALGRGANKGLMLVFDPELATIDLLADPRRYTRDTLGEIARQIRRAVDACRASPTQAVADVGVAGADVIAAANAATTPGDEPFAYWPATLRAYASLHPTRTALVAGSVEVSYRDLLQRADTLAVQLEDAGVAAGQVVGISLPRSVELVVALVAVASLGAAYVPIDPDFPEQRRAFMLSNSQARVLLTSRQLAPVPSFGGLRLAIESIPDPSREFIPPAIGPDQLAYIMYTSGSTGEPKGTCITTANMANFLAGMDELLGSAEGTTWQSVTTPSFDISALELIWTITRGAKLALPASPETRGSSRRGNAADAPAFSLFYFASANNTEVAESYRLLMEGAKFAEANEFEAVWTPERHFHGFGGSFPNPAITSAAVAAITKRVHVRGGSCVLPLHHPLRAAEDWAVVDQLSAGRAGLAVAAGWSPRDFVLAPDNFNDRKRKLLDGVETLRRLWRGETISCTDPNGAPVAIATQPRPVNGAIPIWLTAAKNSETFAEAGRLGCNVLTHLLGMSFADVGANIAVYRKAWRDAGHPGHGRVTLMLHTFIASSEHEARRIVEQPLKRYLASAMDLVRASDWQFPTFTSNPDSVDIEMQSATDQAALLDHAFDRYFETSGLFGTPQSCQRHIRSAIAIGVDEIACLIDFGVAADTVLASLPLLAEAMHISRTAPADVSRTRSPIDGIAGSLVQHGVTHLQCTPSFAAMLLADPDCRRAIAHLDAMLVGGEAMSLGLARDLRQVLTGRLINVYGPTETTIWSTACDIDRVGEFIPLGAPIRNTTLLVEGPAQNPAPPLLAGELLIGGAGVARGYWRREQETAARFVERTLPDGTSQRMYRTGDLVRRHLDGSIEFLGRIDNQVKIRGNRIELSEIEAAIGDQPNVSRAVVVAVGEGDDRRLLAFIAGPADGAAPAEATILDALRQRLPEIMIPSRVIAVEQWPMTPNGKIDRNALAAMAPAATAIQEPVAEPLRPANETEAIVAAAWREVLGPASIGIDRNFFDVGGHSLLAVQLRSRLSERLSRPIALVDVFRFPTIRSMAAHLSRAGQAPEAQQSNSVGIGLERARARSRRRRSGSEALATEDGRIP